MKNKKHYVPVLSVAGSDSSGGAGIQADIKTMSALGCYAMTAITAITAQNTTGVTAIQGIDPEVVRAQIAAVYADIPPLAVKTGMLYSAEVVTAVADELRRCGVRHLVVDPVMVSTSGSRLIDESASDVMVERLFPLAELLTPNVAEAVALTGCSEPDAQAARLLDMGVRHLLLKGGDRTGTSAKTDLLYIDGQQVLELSMPEVPTVNTHGTGCTLSSAIASYLALGHPLTDAVRLAKQYIQQALTSGAGYAIGHGHGPVNHFFRYEEILHSHNS